MPGSKLLPLRNQVTFKMIPVEHMQLLRYTAAIEKKKLGKYHGTGILLLDTNW